MRGVQKKNARQEGFNVGICVIMIEHMTAQHCTMIKPVP